MRSEGHNKYKILVAIAICASSLSAIGTSRAEENAAVKSPTDGQESLAATSFRLTFNLKSPRRFATRYQKQTRTLEVRVSPARAAEFDTSSYYDPNYVHRIVVREELGEVVLGIQLRNLAVGWLVTHQTDPWRLVLDFWRTEEMPRESLDQEWNWQEEHVGSSGDPIQETTQLPKAPHPRQAAEGEGVSGETPAEENPRSLPGESGSEEFNFPPNMGRMEPIAPLGKEKLAALREQVGRSVGTGDEFKRTAELGEMLYLSGQSRQATTVFRRLASLSEGDFRSSPTRLWQAGEAAYLSRKWDLANDYFRTLVRSFPASEVASQAQVRLNDMQWQSLSPAKSTSESSRRSEIQKAWSDLALSPRSSERAKIAASLRVVGGIIDTKPESANLYQQNMDTCVNKSLVPFEMRKNCFYISIRNKIETMEIKDADAAIIAFSRFSENDPRASGLEGLLMQRVEAFLKETQKNRSWQAWIDFERQARPKLLDSTREKPDLLVARAQAWESAGDAKTSAKLYSLAWDKEKNGSKKDEAAAAAARVLRTGGRAAEAERHLRNLENSDHRKRNGLTQNATALVRTLALPPYRHPRAVRILSEEIKTGRHSERDLQALVTLAEAQRTTALGETMYEKVRAFPSSRPEDARTQEKALMAFAQDLMRRGKHAQAAENFFAVANIAQGARRAEAAYNAGLAYSRAGQLEKARASWQLAAGDVSDRKYSTLASERLDRLR